MSSKLPWTRLFADRWILDLACLSPIECNVYIKLRLQMLYTGEPLLNNTKVWANYTGCSVKMFMKALEVLINTGHIERLDDGCLWSLKVEEELNNSNESLDKVSKTSRSKKLSERAKKAAQARWDKHTNDACDDAKASENPDKNDAKAMLNDAKVIKHDANSMLKDAKHDAYDMLNDAYIYNINNNTNINSYNKKTKTIVLAKKEIGSESLETNEQVDEPTEVAAVETTSEQIATGVDNQPPIHEQESVPKKAKRIKADRDCQLPADFEPNLQYAIDKGLTHDEALLEFERFKLHWKDNPCRNAKKSDWQKAWYKWVTHPEYGMLAKKKARLEQEKRLGGHYGKFTQKTFTEQLAEGFNELRDHLSSGEDYGNDQSGVSIDAESWEYIDETGGSANLRCLQSSTSVALCESFS
ncbi:DUF1376 domain-containing protein [Bartonella doshiae]|uniref:Phage related protein n=1 Tax=Bartonella doshiae NCTC 12862 = ATCC 700133 TaxID=1094553 RepID=A0ABP2QP36_BARDO|nr:DUF1376 domain-containing protein [Bartonella doshiae]EJF82122.1 hypothetical protein MCS_00043 [Bartonella doshiae NCTC 12862 = ATCC 700133]